MFKRLIRSTGHVDLSFANCASMSISLSDCLTECPMLSLIADGASDIYEKDHKTFD